MYEKIPLRDRLVRYLQKQHEKEGWVTGKDLQALVMKYTTQTGKTAHRRLNEAVKEGLLEVRKVKGAAQFRAKPKVDWKETHNSMMDLWNKTV